VNSDSVALGQLIAPSRVRRAGTRLFPILSMTMHGGLIDQGSKFKKRVASADTSSYRVVERDQLVVGFPIDEGVLSIQDLYDEAIVSPAYDVWTIKEKRRIIPSYLERFLRSPYALQFYSAKLRGTTARRRTLPDDIFLGLSVPLPSCQEQRRIVAIIDAAEALRAKRRAVLMHINTLTHAMFVDIFGDPETNPKEWRMSHLRDVADVQGGLQVSAARKFLNREVPYLRVANVFRGYLDLREIKMLRATDAEIARTTLVANDLLIVEGHGNAQEIGRAALWDGSITPCVHQNHLIRARFDEKKLVPIVGREYLNSQGGRRHLIRAGKTTSGLNTISVSEVRAVPIPLFPLRLQREFACRVLTVEKLKGTHRASLAEMDALFASLQHRAFAGEL
jgi:type I restriction enzyme, S subunit